LLQGNIFAAKELSLPLDVYKSLLQTLAVRPKKKHFKKIVAYMRKFEPVERITPQLLDQVINVGIAQQYPVTLGQLVRDLIIQGDYNIHKASFMKFVMFMEKCKGFEEDAKKFYTLTGQSSHLQIDYSLVRPMFVRIVKNKGGQEVLKLFEQVRKNIALNQSWNGRDGKEKGAALREIRKDFYDGLIGDLMGFKAYELSEIVMAEKLKEKFTETFNDELIGLNIYAAQRKFADYRQKFELLINDDSPYEFTQHISQELG